MGVESKTIQLVFHSADVTMTVKGTVLLPFYYSLNSVARQCSGAFPAFSNVELIALTNFITF